VWEQVLLEVPEVQAVQEDLEDLEVQEDQAPESVWELEWALLWA
jgi:hypothetical protein